MFFSESADQLSHCKKLIARKPYHQISLDLNSSERFRSSYDPAGIEIKLNVIVMVRRKHRELTFNVRPLRARRERARGCRAAEQRDECAAVHSITSSASASSRSGTFRPSALAVLRLITSSNLVGCTTGRSAGFSPLRMRPT